MDWVGKTTVKIGLNCWVPGLGVVVNLAEAAVCCCNGDATGAIISLVSGAISFSPFSLEDVIKGAIKSSAKEAVVQTAKETAKSAGRKLQKKLVRILQKKLQWVRLKVEKMPLLKRQKQPPSSPLKKQPERWVSKLGRKLQKV